MYLILLIDTFSIWNMNIVSQLKATVLVSEKNTSILITNDYNWTDLRIKNWNGS